MHTHAPYIYKYIQARTHTVNWIDSVDFYVKFLTFYSLACVNMSKNAFPNKGKRGEYRGRTDDLLHAMQAL